MTKHTLRFQFINRVVPYIFNEFVECIFNFIEHFSHEPTLDVCLMNLLKSNKTTFWHANFLLLFYKCHKTYMWTWTQEMGNKRRTNFAYLPKIITENMQIFSFY